jgi:hypothetical protein
MMVAQPFAAGAAPKVSHAGVRGRELLAGLLVLLVAACARAPAVHGVDPAGRIRGYVESSRVTDFCPGSNRPADERCVVTRGWDYDSGVTVVRTYDPAGRLIDTRNPPGADLSLTAPEQARVEALVRSDPRTAPIVNRPGVMFWSGGFVMREPGDAFCDRGSRCIRAIAADDGGNNVVLHSVVDLMSDRVVYPSYEPHGKRTATSSRKAQ